MIVVTKEDSVDNQKTRKMGDGWDALHLGEG